MTDHDHFTLQPDACVTASELVRQFGLWQERALQQPVFVLRRGRPSLVLTSLDLMRRLCAPHDAPAAEPLAALLLDALRESVLLVDAGGRIEQLNRAARIAFAGGAAAVGQPLAHLLPDAVAHFLLDLAERARRGGTAETAEIAVRERLFRVAIVPLPAGALLVADDVSADDEAATAAARLEALDRAFDALGEVAWLRVNLRGYVEAASEGVARLAGIDRAALLAVRFVTLLDIASRSAAGEAIEAVIADGSPRTLTAALNRREGGTRPIRLALAAERARGRVACVTVALHAVG